MDDSVAVVRKSFPGVKLIQLRQNRGFTGGNLAGFEEAGGEFIALINNDARVDERWLANLLQPMLDDCRVGICASKLVFAGTGQINSAGDGLTTGGVGLNRGLNRSPKDFEKPDLVFGACGAAVLYRRKMLNEIGFLDDDFFLYDEDTDL